MNPVLFVCMFSAFGAASAAETSKAVPAAAAEQKYRQQTPEAASKPASAAGPASVHSASPEAVSAAAKKQNYGPNAIAASSEETVHLIYPLSFILYYMAIQEYWLQQSRIFFAQNIFYSQKL